MKFPALHICTPVLSCLTTLVFSTASMLTQAADSSLVLVNNESTDYRIVVSAQAIPSERYAAEELQTYLQKATGVRLAIVNDGEPSTAREILVGESKRLQELKVSLPGAKLGSDGFILRTQGGRLIIAGGKPRGTLNGVYTFLEEQIGVRWFTPELEKVPGTNRLLVAAQDRTHVPVLEYREVFWTEMMRNADFAARHRQNGNHYQLAEKHGGRFAVYHPFVHSFDALVPPGLFKDHPEYFPLIDGQRKGGYVQRCLTNPDVLKMSKERVRQWIKDNPQATIISVSQNDTFNYCHCEKCKAIDDAEGTPCATLLNYVNAIAEDIEKDYPHVRIDTLAYQYTRTPPKTIRPRANVIIRLCSIECCFAHPLDACPSEANRRFRDDIIAWQPVAPLLYIWDYTPNFAHYLQPFPNFDSLQANVRFFVNHRVKGLFEQGNYSPGGNGEMGPLRSYLLAKLLWNPETDLERHKQEFLAAYFDTAAPKINAYLDVMQRQVRDGKAHAHIFDSTKSAYLNDAFVTEADAILAEAEQAAGNDVVRDRVRVARLPVWYVQLVTNRVAGEDRAALLKKFLEVARKAGISHISESQALDAWAAKMEGK